MDYLEEVRKELREEDEFLKRKKVISNMWWAYKHSNGSIIVKRWFGDHKDYQDDCYDNDFILQVIPPFAAESREEAFQIAKRRLG
jgi:hypothetical protein